MTRLRFILVSFFAAVAALFGRRKEQVRGLHVKTYKFTAVTNNFTFRPIVLQTKDGIWQWRCRGQAMSPEFSSVEDAIAYKGPFLTIQDRRFFGYAA